MDDFLTKLYHEELEKNAGAGQRALFDALPASDLEAYLGLDKTAVGGPVEPEVSPAMKKSIEARETKGKDTEKRVAQAQSKSETQPTRNIERPIPGQSVPERNFTQPGSSIPENTLAVKQGSAQWADSMGRHLAHMDKQAEEAEKEPEKKEEPKKQAEIGKASCAMGKAAAAARSIKLAHQMPAEMLPALIEMTAREMNKVASEPSKYDAIERYRRVKRLGKAQRREELRQSPMTRGVRQGAIGALLGGAVGSGPMASQMARHMQHGYAPEEILSHMGKLKKFAPLVGAALGGTLGALRGRAKAHAAQRVSGGADKHIGEAISATAKTRK